jgi:hypothetical protein
MRADTANWGLSLVVGSRRSGRIMRAPNGVYTPLDGSGKTEWDRPLTDYAAEQGCPIPV